MWWKRNAAEGRSGLREKWGGGGKGGEEERGKGAHGHRERERESGTFRSHAKSSDGGVRSQPRDVETERAPTAFISPPQTISSCSHVGWGVGGRTKVFLSSKQTCLGTKMLFTQDFDIKKKKNKIKKGSRLHLELYFGGLSFM